MFAQQGLQPKLLRRRYDSVLQALLCTVPYRRVLVFGGNGFLGASSVQRLLERKQTVTIVNRGNWYWDVDTRILPHVHSISCDRDNGVHSCAELVSLIDSVGQYCHRHRHFKTQIYNIKNRTTQLMSATSSNPDVRNYSFSFTTGNIVKFPTKPAYIDSSLFAITV